MTHNDRSQRMTPTRRAMAFAGAATIAFSLVLSIVPALAANAGTMKVYDASSNAETSATDPHVCGFYAEFTGTDVTGSWWLYDWSNPHALLDSGDFAIVGQSVYVTDVFELPAGHYRFQGQSSADNAPKAKTLWVDEGCSYGPSSPTEDPTPTPTPTPTVTPTPTPTPTPSEVVVEDPTPIPTPESDVKDATQPTPSPSQEVEQQVAAGQSTDGSTTLPDTAIPVTQSGVLATIGLLLIIAAHAGTRRERHLPVA
jgi:hypothetical protein